ncbi:helix-turn-helix domain-containing protein [Runella sp. SP2]|uniref:helix-turn-helix domain-containing protein n=1 Tax=Runella sp. SP2 TaxID=2268026 RepID=UPI000F07C9F6|nr:helix-turn-helix transcriptional regulator [Runella sp. SP2]AYQ31953.1 XRE family transcriptional regulator [Runella sp. SP2]
MESIHLGRRVKKVFDRAGHTIEEAARRVEISTSNLYKKIGSEDLDTEFLRRVSRAYGVSLSSFFSDNQYGNVRQEGIVNAVGEKIIQSYQKDNKGGTTTNTSNELEVLSERLKGCEAEKEGLKRQIELLEKMVKMYETATTIATK